MSGRLLINPSTGLPVLIGGQLLVMPQLAATPTVAVLAASPVVDVLEGETAVIRVSVDPAVAANPLTFTYATVPGTALAGTDFAAITSTATIPAGQSYVDLLIPTINRSGTNGSRSFTVTISNAQAGTNPINLSNPTATITIADVASGVVLPTLGLETVTAQNEGTSLVFRVRASKTHTAAVSLAYTTQPGSALAGTDYTTQSGTKTIAIGQSFVDITVPTIARAGYQGARSFSVLISAATDGTNTIDIHTPSVSGTIRDTEVPTGQHAYFEAIVASPNYHVGHSMRPVPGQPKTYPTGHPHAGKLNPYYANQLLGTSTSEQGYANAGNVGGFSQVTYSPATDTHPQAQDAMRTAIPPWQKNYSVKATISPSATTIYVHTPDAIEINTTLLIDNELMSVTNRTDQQPLDSAGGRYINVSRGFKGTTPVEHTVGTLVRISLYSLWPQWRPPIGTADGNAYFLAWEFYITENFRPPPLNAYKAFQLGTIDGTWMEMQIRFNVGVDYQPPTYDPDEHVAVATWRYYGGLTTEPSWAVANAGKSKIYGRYIHNDGGYRITDPLYPMLHSTGPLAKDGGFLLHSGRWSRCCVLYKQSVNDWDEMTIWMMDEVQEPRQEYNTLKLSVGGLSTGGNRSLRNFWVEHNTSQQEMSRGWTDYASPSLIPVPTMYQKNLGVLKLPYSTTPEDVAGWLLKPGAGAP